MGESTQKIIKNLIIEYMQDGKKRSVSEISEYLLKKGVDIEKKSSSLRTALYSLKNENVHFINPEKGFYYMEKYDEEENEKKQQGYDFSDFETIEKNIKKELTLVLTIFEDGSFALNSPLLVKFPERRAEIKLKRDCSQIALLLNGEKKINLGKNGRTKKYYILNRLKEQNKKFPIYYSGEWDENEKIWLGDITDINPNKHTK